MKILNKKQSSKLNLTNPRDAFDFSLPQKLSHLAKAKIELLCLYKTKIPSIKIILLILPDYLYFIFVKFLFLSLLSLNTNKATILPINRFVHFKSMQFAAARPFPIYTPFLIYYLWEVIFPNQNKTENTQSYLY